MKKAAIFLLFLSCLAVMILSGAEARAEIMLEVRNNTSGQAFVCLSYHDTISDGIITRGWWDVPAFGNRSIRVNTDKDDFMWFIYNERDQVWGGEKGEPDSEYRHVVKENFFVKAGWKPRGNQHMRVYLKKTAASGKRFRIELTNSNGRKVDGISKGE